MSMTAQGAGKPAYDHVAEEPRQQGSVRRYACIGRRVAKATFYTFAIVFVTGIFVGLLMGMTSAYADDGGSGGDGGSSSAGSSASGGGDGGASSPGGGDGGASSSTGGSDGGASSSGGGDSSSTGAGTSSSGGGDSSSTGGGNSSSSANGGDSSSSADGGVSGSTSVGVGVGVGGLSGPGSIGVSGSVSDNSGSSSSSAEGGDSSTSSIGAKNSSVSAPGSDTAPATTRGISSTQSEGSAVATNDGSPSVTTSDTSSAPANDAVSVDGKSVSEPSAGSPAVAGETSETTAGAAAVAATAQPGDDQTAAEGINAPLGAYSVPGVDVDPAAYSTPSVDVDPGAYSVPGVDVDPGSVTPGVPVADQAVALDPYAMDPNAYSVPDVDLDLTGYYTPIDPNAKVTIANPVPGIVVDYAPSFLSPEDYAGLLDAANPDKDPLGYFTPVAEVKDELGRQYVLGFDLAIGIGAGFRVGFQTDPPALIGMVRGWRGWGMQGYALSMPGTQPGWGSFEGFMQAQSAVKVTPGETPTVEFGKGPAVVGVELSNAPFQTPDKEWGITGYVGVQVPFDNQPYGQPWAIFMDHYNPVTGERKSDEAYGWGFGGVNGVAAGVRGAADLSGFQRVVSPPGPPDLSNSMH
jgi:hypothetical protein